MTANPLSCLAAIAETQIGAQEDAAHTNRGAAIRKFQDATELAGTQGWPWCAAFVDWCVEQFILQFPNKIGVMPSERPRTASAFGWKAWAKKHGCEIFTEHSRAQRGDVVIFTFSHIGIVVANNLGELETVEGNTNPAGGRDGYGVFHRSRTPELKLVDSYIRLPARAEPA